MFRDLSVGGPVAESSGLGDVEAALILERGGGAPGS